MAETITHADVVDWIRAYAAQIAEQKTMLTRLDAAIGDADHGTNMDRGMRKVLEKLDGVEGTDIGATLKAVGMALVSSVGGASGPLYGTLFMQMGAGSAGASELDLGGWTEALAKGVAGVQARGKAELEDKTMVDALLPAVDALRERAGGSLAEAVTASADAARQGMEATTPLVARKGRASYLGERSAGHQDPGATSSHLLLRTAADTFAG
ncbi:MAG: dihydroxyacetone kinase subunit DhaL [Solirubrobacteraceae bacterium]